MEELLSFVPVALDWQTVLLCTLTAFVLSAVVAKTYELTYQGLTQSRSLVQALVLGSIVGCLIMLAIGDNVARSIGIVGSLAIIRFRTNLRDPRDMVFVFAAIGIGVACGVQSFVTAVVGTAVFVGAAAALRLSNVGVQRTHDGLVRFVVPGGDEGQGVQRAQKVLASTTREFALVTMRNVAKGQVDCSYQVKLRSSTAPKDLMTKLGELDGISGLSYMNQAKAVDL